MILSKRMAKTLEFIARYTHEHRYPPTMREIANGVGLKSIPALRSRLLKLKELGYVDWKYNSARTVTIKEGLTLRKLSTGEAITCMWGEIERDDDE